MGQARSSHSAMSVGTPSGGASHRPGIHTKASGSSQWGILTTWELCPQPQASSDQQEHHRDPVPCSEQPGGRLCSACGARTQPAAAAVQGACTSLCPPAPALGLARTQKNRLGGHGVRGQVGVTGIRGQVGGHGVRGQVGGHGVGTGWGSQGQRTGRTHLPLCSGAAGWAEGLGAGPWPLLCPSSQ